MRLTSLKDAFVKYLSRLLWLGRPLSFRPRGALAAFIVSDCGLTTSMHEHPYSRVYSASHMKRLLLPRFHFAKVGSPYSLRLNSGGEAHMTAAAGVTSSAVIKAPKSGWQARQIGTMVNKNSSGAGLEVIRGPCGCSWTVSCYQLPTRNVEQRKNCPSMVPRIS